MTFPDDLLDVRDEIEVDGEWVDISDGRLFDQTVTITRGRSDESQLVAPSSMSATYDNADGALTPSNPESPYWPAVDRGTRYRRTLPDPSGDDAWLRMPSLTTPLENGVAAPDSAGLSVTGDLWVAADFTPARAPATYWTDGTASGAMLLIAKWTEVSDERSYLLSRDNVSGDVTIRWSTAGTDATVRSLTMTGNPRLAFERTVIGVHLDVNNGAGGVTAHLYEVDEWGDTWVLVDSTTEATTTSIYDSTASATFGWTANSLNLANFQGLVHHAEIRSGDSTGTLRADPDFTAATPGDATLVDGVGNTWTLAGTSTFDEARIVRFAGMLGEISTEWPWGDIEDATNDGESHSTLSAGGVLRRLRQGSRQSQSPLRRAVEGISVSSIGTGPFQWNAYFPFEAMSGAADVLGGNADATFSGVTFTGEPFPGSDTTATLRLGTADSRWTTRITAPKPTPSGVWLAVLWVLLDEVPTGSDKVELLRVNYTGNTGSIYTRLLVKVASGEPRLNIAYGDGTTETVGSMSGAFPAGEWVRVWIWQSSTDFIGAWQQVSDQSVGNAAGGVLPVAGASTVSRVRIVSADAASVSGSMRFAHLVVGYADGVPPGNIDEWDRPEAGYVGEVATVRFFRLCRERGVPGGAFQAAVPSVPMGPQTTGTFTSLLDEVAAVDGGVIVEDFDTFGLAYRPSGAIFNQEPVVVLDAAGESAISNPYVTVKDDQGFRNEITAQRPGGSSFTATTDPAPADEDVYDEAVTVNVVDDPALGDQAAWRLHKGTWPANRSPTITVDLAVAPHLATDVVRLREGDLVRLINMPSQHPLGPEHDFIVQGISESQSPNVWRLTLNASPAGPWSVAVLEDDTLGRLDTAGAELSTGIDDNDTSLSVATTLGPLWITTSTHGAEFPFDVLIGGERMTVTAITGGSSPQTFTVTRSTNGVAKAHASGASVVLADPAVLAL